MRLTPTSPSHPPPHHDIHVTRPTAVTTRAPSSQRAACRAVRHRCANNAGLALVMLGALLTSGCLPIAYATPPARVTALAGLQHIRTTSTLTPDAHARDGFQHQLSLRGTIAPLQLPRTMHDRVWDIGLGYSSQWGRADGAIHGPLLEIGALQPLNASGSTRWGVRTLFHVMSSGRGRLDTLQGGLQATIEWVAFADEPHSTHCSDVEGDDYCGIGYAYGEGGVGVVLEANHARLPGAQMWAVTLGVSFRIPSTVGAGLLFLDLDDVF